MHPLGHVNGPWQALPCWNHPIKLASLTQQPLIGWRCRSYGHYIGNPCSASEDETSSRYIVNYVQYSGMVCKCWLPTSCTATAYHYICETPLSYYSCPPPPSPPPPSPPPPNPPVPPAPPSCECRDWAAVAGASGSLCSLVATIRLLLVSTPRDGINLS